MKKNRKTLFRVIPLLVMLCLFLTGCKCKHQWESATCEEPKTCSLCGVTEGDTLEHDWEEANCEDPKTCEECDKTEGEALGHTWVDATCQAPKTCSVCQKTEGEVGEHKWIDATTETPKTCSVCQATEGERIITDSRFKTADNKALFGTWSGVVKMDCQEIVGPGFATKAEMSYAITFNPDGSYKEITQLLNEEAFIKAAEDYFLETLYSSFSQNGLNKEQANAAMEDEYGMTAEEYAKKYISSINWKNLFAVDVDGVYYASGDTLYSGKSWSATLETDSFSITGNRLMIETLQEQFPDLEMMRQQVNI